MWCCVAREKAEGIRDRASSFRRKADKAISSAGYDEWVDAIAVRGAVNRLRWRQAQEIMRVHEQAFVDPP